MIGLCQPCKEKGKFRAVYKVVGGVPMCGGCVADREANPPEPAKPQAPEILEDAKNDKEEKGKTMPKQIDEGTRQEILKDADAGMSVEQIRKKHNVGWITAKNIIDGSGKSAAGKKRAGGGDSSSAPRRAAAKHAAKNSASRWADTISQLREERDRIDRVIGELEQMN